eukprot:Awhi_evm1s7297
MNTDSDCAADEFCSNANAFQQHWCTKKLTMDSKCDDDGECISGICASGFSKKFCSTCRLGTENDNCAADEYCDNTKITENKPQHCKDKKSHGEPCRRDRMCTSGKCENLYCGECKSDDECDSSKYCFNLHAIAGATSCSNRLSLGATCNRDRECQTGQCAHGRCSECANDDHCPGHQYCHNKNIVFSIKTCKDKKCTGWCARKNECKSGKCNFPGRCKKC